MSLTQSQSTPALVSIIGTKVPKMIQTKLNNNDIEITILNT